MAFRFQPDSPLGAELVRAVRAQIDAAADAIAEQLAAGERAHRARVCCKKIRAALRLIRPHQRKVWARENAFFRDSARKLSLIRESTAVLASLDALRREWEGKVDKSGFAIARRALVAEQRQRLPSASDLQHQLEQFGTRMRKADARLANWKIRGDGFEVVAEGIEHTYRRARRAFRHAGAEGTAEAFHTWRKHAKAHAYQGRLFRCAWPAIMKKWERAQTLLSHLLGDEHDLAVLQKNIHDHVEHIEKDSPVGDVLGLIEERRAELQAEALVLGQRIFAEKPKAFVARLAIWWASARDATTKTSVA
jgi:CHAD domain-containing protein